MINNYFTTHPMYKDFSIAKNKRNNFFQKYKWELKKLWKSLNKDVKILEIGFWNWGFAYFCRKYWFKNYTGIDIDDTFIEQNKKEFKNYLFKKQDFQNFLKDAKKYDIIFISHVFEHLNKNEAGELIKLIYSSLNTWWYRINYMPNADSNLNACSLRYHDITHKYIYNSNSFEQIILSNGIEFSKINHSNSFPAINHYIKILFRIIHPIFLWITKLYYYWMWYSFPKTYTSEILSIIKK